MTAFFTRAFTSGAAEARRTSRRRVLRWCLASLLLAGSALPGWAAGLTALRADRAEDGVYLTATVSFELPPVVEDALLKGIALIFVVEADVYRERWYWTDKLVATASRSMRLAYQPLTRRWRVSMGSEPGDAGRVALAQSYDALPEALGAIERISRWKIAESSDIDASNHFLNFRFRLDQGALPRPFQIGIAGQREWQISLERRQKLLLERVPVDAPPVTDK
jgi:hypothetical protein